MFKKFLIVFAIFFSSFLVSFPADAQNTSSQIPALNPFCWKKKECVDTRRKYVANNPTDEQLAKDGFVTGASVAPCVGGTGNDEWGRCLPAGQSKTEISFGGQDRFSNVGDFILLMYRYLISVAGILAVVVIIFAGVQWITSGGNSETISSAKHRISGAVIGLFIAYGSYFILNTINPALVNLRLPQVWLVRPQQLIPKFCKQLEGAEEGRLKFRFYALESDQVSEVDISKAGNEEMPYGQKDANGLDIFSCGRRFLAEDSGTQTCFGDVCGLEQGNRQGCVEWNSQSPDAVACYKGDLFVSFSIDTESFGLGQQVKEYAADVTVLKHFVEKALQTDWRKDSDVFRAVCKIGNTVYLANRGGANWWNQGSGRKNVIKNVKKGSYHEYIIGYSELADPESLGWNCNKGGSVVGYLLRVETYADQSTWDRFGPSLDQFIVPLYGQVDWAINAIGGPAEPNLAVGYDRRTRQALFGTFSDDVKTINNYIPLDEIKKGGMTLDVRINAGHILRMKSKTGENPSDFPENIEPGVPAQ
ncbi:MAG: TrbC/VirB2 family protein [Candidatus Magasanikbacteria bacterium]|nr:TrbC/VirB2 family protein [Candidatus Magasanikbacteria bacterium]